MDLILKALGESAAGVWGGMLIHNRIADQEETTLVDFSELLLPLFYILCCCTTPNSDAIFNIMKEVTLLITEEEEEKQWVLPNFC